MSTERDALFQGVEGAGGPSQAAGEDMSASEMSDTATACHSGVQVEQQTDSQVNTGRADAEAVRQSHGGAKRRRGAARSSIPTSERRRSRRFALVRSGSGWLRARGCGPSSGMPSTPLGARSWTPPWPRTCSGSRRGCRRRRMLASWPRRFARWRSTSTTSTAGRGLVSQWRCRRRCPS